MKVCSECKSPLSERTFSDDGAEEDYFCIKCVDYVSALGSASGFCERDLDEDNNSNQPKAYDPNLW